MSRSLFVSKSFWLNVLTASVEVTGALAGVIPARSAYSTDVATTLSS